MAERHRPSRTSPRRSWRRRASKSSVYDWARMGQASVNGEVFDWPIENLALGRLGLSTFYRRQRQELDGLIHQYQPDIVHGQGVDLAGYLAVNCGLPSVVTVHGILWEDAKYHTELKRRARGLLTALLLERHTMRRAVN